MSKDEFRGDYQRFLNSPGGIDFMNQARLLEQSLILGGISAQESDKASYLNKLQGVYSLRDYIMRLGGKSGVGTRSPDPSLATENKK